MSLSSKHLNHMNIVDSRRAAIKFIKKNKGLPVFFINAKYNRAQSITLIKQGFLDGYNYGLSVNPQCIRFSPNMTAHRRI
jgi:hypothetical protein